MQFRLRTLSVLIAFIFFLIYCGVLNAPSSIAIPVFCVIVWLTPAYWIAGVIYARDARRAFFIGGLASGAVPFLALVCYSVIGAFEGWGSWGYGGYRRSVFGEIQRQNLIASLFIFAPVMLSFIGGCLSMAVYFALQPPSPVPPFASPFRPTSKPIL